MNSALNNMRPWTTFRFPCRGIVSSPPIIKMQKKLKTETKTVKTAFFGNSNLTQPQLKLSSYSIQAHNSIKLITDPISYPCRSLVDKAKGKIWPSKKIQFFWVARLWANDVSVIIYMHYGVCFFILCQVFSSVQINIFTKEVVLSQFNL